MEKTLFTLRPPNYYMAIMSFIPLTMFLAASVAFINRNTIPNDKRSPFDPSGIRIGTPAVTTRGMKEKEIKKIAELISKTLKGRNVRTEVKKLALKFPPPNC